VRPDEDRPAVASLAAEDISGAVLAEDESGLFNLFPEPLPGFQVGLAEGRTRDPAAWITPNPG
jgi:hypothetical protein